MPPACRPLLSSDNWSERTGKQVQSYVRSGAWHLLYPLSKVSSPPFSLFPLSSPSLSFSVSVRLWRNYRIGLKFLKMYIIQRISYYLSLFIVYWLIIYYMIYVIHCILGFVLHMLYRKNYIMLEIIYSILPYIVYQMTHTVCVCICILDYTLYIVFTGHLWWSEGCSKINNEEKNLCLAYSQEHK